MKSVFAQAIPIQVACTFTLVFRVFLARCTLSLFSISLLCTCTAGGRSRCAFLVVSTWPECLARGKPCLTVMAKRIDCLESVPDDQNPPLSTSTACAGEGENAKDSNDPWSPLVRLDTGVIGLEGEVVRPSTQPMPRRRLDVQSFPDEQPEIEKLLVTTERFRSIRGF